jgi:hypothetical protein
MKTSSIKAKSASTSEDLNEILKSFYLKNNFLPNLIEGEVFIKKTIPEVYVLPHIQVLEDNGVVTPITQEIFFNQNARSYPYGKLLIKGAPGIGKTSFLQNIAYRWATGEIYSNIKYLFRVDFKNLARFGSFYDGDNKRLSPLECLINYYYYLEDNDLNIDMNQIKDILKNRQDETLILVDTIDLAEFDSGDVTSKKILSAVLGLKNTIFISDPDSLNQEIQDGFSKVITITGFCNKKAAEYIEKFFDSQAVELNKFITDFANNPKANPENNRLSLTRSPANFKKKLLEYCKKNSDVIAQRIRDISGKIDGVSLNQIMKSVREYFDSSKAIALHLLENSNLAELIRIPVTANMLCLVLSIPASRERLEGNITLAGVYKEFMLLFARRKLDKKITDFHDLLANKDFQFLAELSLEPFRNQGAISGRVLKSLARKYSSKVEDILRLELLKNVSDNKFDLSMLESLSFIFNNSNIQSFLAAIQLSNMLADDIENKEAAEFIAKHRNSQIFLPVLKFISDLLSDPQAMNSSKNAKIQFWEAVSCNRDGVLELGEDIMVTRLMHLLVSSSRNGFIDQTIPNIQKIENFIEKIVTKDLMKWSKTLKESGYLPHKIKILINDNIISYVEGFNDNGNALVLQKSSQKIFDARALLSIVYDWMEAFDINVLLPRFNEILARSEDQEILELVIRIHAKILKLGNRDLVNLSTQNTLENIVLKLNFDGLYKYVYEYLYVLLDLYPEKKDILIKALFNEIPKAAAQNLWKMFAQLFKPNIINDILVGLKDTIANIGDMSVDFNVWRNCAGIIKELINNPELSPLVVDFFTTAIEILVREYELNGKGINIGDIDLTNSINEQDELISRPLRNLLNMLINTINNVEAKSKNEIIQAIKIRTTSNFKFMILKNIELKGIDQNILSALLNEIIKEDNQHIPEIILKIIETEIELAEDMAISVYNLLNRLLTKEEIEEKHHIFLSLGYLARFLNQKSKDIINEIFGILIHEDNISDSYDGLLQFCKINFYNNQLITNFKETLKGKIYTEQKHYFLLPLIALLNQTYENDIFQLWNFLINQLKQPELSPEILKAFSEIAQKSDILGREYLDLLIEELKSQPNIERFFKVLSYFGDALNNNQQFIPLKYTILENLFEILKLSGNSRLKEEIIKFISNFLLDNVENKFTNKITNLDTLQDEDDPFKVQFLNIIENIDTFDSYYLMIYLNDNVADFNKLVEYFDLGCSKEKLKFIFSRIITLENIGLVINLIDHEKIERREFFVEILKDYLQNLSASLEDVKTLLSILKATLYDFDEKYKMELFDLARFILKEVADLAVVDEIIEQIYSQMSDYLAINEEDTVEFLKMVFAVALEDSQITKIESKFILRCITELKFSISISRPEFNQNREVQFSIEFQDKIYNFVGYDNLIYMEAFSTWAIKSSNNELAVQYREGKPLFINSGGGIRVAAIDEKSCKSKINKQEIDYKDWLASYLYKSNDTKDDVENVIMLIERRVLGRYVADKIYISEGKLQREHFEIHPEDLNVEFYEKIFGPMKYTNTKPRYFAKTFNIDPRLGSKLLKNIPSSQNSQIDLSSSSFDLVSSIMSAINPPSPQKRVKATTLFDQDIEIEAQFYQSLKQIFENNNFADFLNQNQIVGTLSQERDLIELKREHLIEFDLRDRTNSIAINDERQNSQIKGLQLTLDSLKIDLKILQDTEIKRTYKSQQKQKELAIITKDPYKQAFYKALRMELNAFYIAASAISSGLVKGENDEPITKIGNLLSTISSHTPLVGIGLALIAEVCKGIGDYQQDVKISAYQNLVADSNEMAKLAEKIARRIALAEMTPVEEQSVLEQAIDVADQITSTSVSSVVTKVFHEFSERLESAKSTGAPGDVAAFASRFVAGPEDNAQSQGESAAKIVAKKIIANIITGKYEVKFNDLTDLDNLTPLTKTANEIADDVLSVFNGKTGKKLGGKKSSQEELIKKDDKNDKSDKSDKDNSKNNGWSCLFPWICYQNDIVYDDQEFVASVFRQAKENQVFKVANKILEVEEIAKLIEMVKDDEVLDFFVSELELLEDHLKIIFNKLPQDQELAAYNKIKEFLGSEFFSLHYENNLKSKSKELQDLLVITANWITKIENMLEQQHNSDQVIGMFAMLDDLINIQASLGVRGVAYRPPYQDPDDFGYSGFGGSGSDGALSNNSSGPNSFAIPVILPFNLTMGGYDWPSE